MMYKNKLKRNIDLNIRAKTIKLLEENTGKNLYGLKLISKDFLDRTQKT